jgi:hypothetical protein
VIVQHWACLLRFVPESAGGFGEGWFVMGAFQDWTRERAEIEKEMDRLIAAGRPSTAEERKVRQLQFSALIERRDTAARNLLRAGSAERRPKPSGQSSN